MDGKPLGYYHLQFGWWYCLDSLTYLGDDMPLKKGD